MKSLIVPQHQVQGVLDGSITLLIEVIEKQPEEQCTLATTCNDNGESCVDRMLAGRCRGNRLPLSGERLYLAEDIFAECTCKVDCRCASRRTTIEIVSCGVKRLQEMTESDARKAGHRRNRLSLSAGAGGEITTAISSLRCYWDEHHTPEQAWDKNLWCAFTGIRRVER